MRITLAIAAIASVLSLTTTGGFAADDASDGIKRMVQDIIHPLMRESGIPGVAVGIVADGTGYVFDYGIASKETRDPVTDDTLFEIGSLSKTFTAVLASYARVQGRLSLSDKVANALPDLRGSRFGEVSLLNLGTHTPGGMPLQVPDEVATDAQLMAYLKAWAPTYPPGTTRTYANPSIGMLGLIAAKSFDRDFSVLEKDVVFKPLGMTSTYLDVPLAEQGRYAQGYTKQDVPIRMAPGPLAAEAYGIRTTAGDMLRFIEANLDPTDGGTPLQKAIRATHTGYFTVGGMTQDLIWEQYPYPVAIETLLAGNSAKIAYEPNPVTAIVPPSPPHGDVLINKTGSTNGFGAYVAFVPARKLGIVILANKNYPVEARVKAAYAILTKLDPGLSASP